MARFAHRSRRPSSPGRPTERRMALMTSGSGFATPLVRHHASWSGGRSATTAAVDGALRDLARATAAVPCVASPTPRRDTFLESQKRNAMKTIASSVLVVWMFVCTPVPVAAQPLPVGALGGGATAGGGWADDVPPAGTRSRHSVGAPLGFAVCRLYGAAAAVAGRVVESEKVALGAAGSHDPL